MTISIKKGDTARAITDTLSLAGSPINLTGAAVVLVWNLNGTVSRKTATIVSAAAGTVSYAPEPADVSTVGTVLLEWEITFADTTVLTVPTLRPIRLEILPDLG